MFGSKQSVTLNVTGMTCDNCVGHVTKALQNVDGVKKVDVSLDGPALVVAKPGTRATDMVDAIREAGYDATVASEAL